MKNDVTDKSIMRRYLDDMYTQEEARVLLSRLKDDIHAPMLDELTTDVWKEAAMEELTTGMEREKYKEEASRLLKRIEHKKRTWFRRIVLTVASASAVVLLIFGGINLLGYMDKRQISYLEASTSYGESRQIRLPDGTQLILNSCSRVRYPNSFVEDERQIELEGEAYFEVTKNRHKPFTVQSDAIRVRVLGTTFNLKSDKRCRIAEATLIEGEIEVKGNKEEGQIILTPGQRAELNKNNGRLTVKQVDAKLDAVWHDNLIPFQKADIFTITKALERFYDVKIILSPDIKSDKTYSGVLKKKDNIESVLQSLDNSIPINYKIVGDNIFISSRNK